MASKKPLRPPRDIVQSIESKAAEVREAATALSARIERFRKHLSTLRGRVETICQGTHPDASHDETLFLVLKFHREGKEWVLSWTTIDELTYDPTETLTYHLLSEAPLKIKIAAVKLFPELLERMEKAQDDLVKEINAASNEFDVFAALMQIPNSEGK